MASLSPTKYFNPGNPFDTGLPGEENREVLGRYLDAGQHDYLRSLGWDPNAPVHAHDNPNMPQYQGTSSGSYLAGDAEFNQLLQDMKAESVSDKASRDAGIKRSFINFGLGNFDLAKAAQATGVGDLASILDPQTLELARNNQFSVQKRIERGMADRQRDNRVALRQRGGVRSGESGFLAQRAQTDFDTDMFDSSQKLLDYISGAQSAFAQAERDRQRRQFEMALQAALRRQSFGGRGYTDYPEPAAPTSGPATYTNPLTGHTWTQVGGDGGEWTRWPGKAS